MTTRKNGRKVAPEIAAGGFVAQAMGLFRREAVALPEGMTAKAFVKTLSAAESDRLTRAAVRPGKQLGRDDDALDIERLNEMMYAAALVDGAGNRLIPEGEEAALSALPSAVVTAIRMAFARLNEPGDAAKN